MQIFRIFITLILLMAGTASVGASQSEKEYFPQKHYKELAKLLRQGDIVSISTKDEWVFEFEIDKVTGDAIIGQNVSVPFNEISRLESRRIFEEGAGASMLLIMMGGIFKVILAAPITFY